MTLRFGHPGLRLLSVLAALTIFSALPAEGAELSAWLGFLPKAQRTKAAAYAAAMDGDLRALLEDRKSSLDSESAYARAAAVMARRLSSAICAATHSSIAAVTAASLTVSG